MQKRLVVSSSPFLRSNATTQRIMLDVVIAMLPTALAAVWFFGGPALGLMIIAVAAAVASEWLYNKLMHKKSTIGDLSAVVTGLLVAFNIPANAPYWMPIVGSVIAIVLVKQMFGGIGQNVINPALAARTILMLSWAGLMAAKAIPDGGQIFRAAVECVDTVSAATPLVADTGKYSLWALFSGNVPGMMGETCKLTLILGGIYLIVRKVIDWRIPVCFIATVFVLSFIKTGVIYSEESGVNNALYQIMSGGLILGAFFMATDYVTSPITKWGRVIMGVGCGALLFVIRTFNKSYPEGCSFAILFMNVMTPLIDKWTAPKPFGAVKAPKDIKEGVSRA